MITQYKITSNEWTPISAAGQSVKIWLNEDSDDFKGQVDIRIIHSGLGVPDDSKITEGKRIFKTSGNKDCFEQNPDSNEDVFYLKANSIDDEAMVSVDAFTPDSISSVYSFSRNAVISTSYEDDYRVMGYQRVFKDFFEDIPQGVTWYLFDPTGMDENRLLFVLPIKISVSNGPVVIELFENVTASANGVLLDTFNPNRLSDFVHKSKIYAGATISSQGTRLNGESFGDTGGFLTPDVGGESGSSQPFILDKSKKYAFRINNTSGGVIDIFNAYFAWYEIDNV